MPEDLPFLRELYATTREDELRIVPWSEADKARFLDMQFQAQKAHYEEFYPDCAFLVIELDGAAVGRLYIDRSGTEIAIIDIALLPAHRGHGLGTMLLGEILEESRRCGKPVEIYVESFNPARHLYDRLGFRHIDDNGVYHRLVWSPT